MLTINKCYGKGIKKCEDKNVRKKLVLGQRFAEEINARTKKCGRN